MKPTSSYCKDFDLLVLISHVNDNSNERCARFLALSSQWIFARFLFCLLRLILEKDNKQISLQP